METSITEKKVTGIGVIPKNWDDKVFFNRRSGLKKDPIGVLRRCLTTMFPNGGEVFSATLHRHFITLAVPVTVPRNLIDDIRADLIAEKEFGQWQLVVKT